MRKLLKYLVYLIIFLLLCLLIYTIFGDLTEEPQAYIQSITFGSD